MFRRTVVSDIRKAKCYDGCISSPNEDIENAREFILSSIIELLLQVHP